MLAFVLSVVVSVAITTGLGIWILIQLLEYLDSPLPWFKGHSHDLVPHTHPAIERRLAELEAAVRIDAHSLHAYGSLLRERRALEDRRRP